MLEQPLKNTKSPISTPKRYDGHPYHPNIAGTPLGLNANKLSLNVEKSNHVIFHPSQQKVPSINLTVNQKKLEHKEYLKDLGVLIDSKLSWNHTFGKSRRKFPVVWEF